MKKKSSFGFIILIFVIFVSVAVGAIFFIRKKNNDKTLNIAFYGLPHDLCKAIQEEFSDDQKVTARFDILAADDFDFGIITKKYDIFFAWNGEITQTLSESAEKIPAKILENVPVFLQNKKSVPVLLDFSAIAVNAEIVQKTQVNPKESFQSFADFLHESGKFVFSPFFAVGSDDKTLLSLTGSFVQAVGGADAYKNLINQMQTYEKLDDFISTGLDDDGFSFGDVLDMIKVWKNEALLHPRWNVATKKDLEIFAEQNQIASFFTNLSEYTKIPFSAIEKFEITQMPFADENVPHCVIAPSVSAVLISANSNAKKFLENLLNVDVQTKLSEKTALAPVNYGAETTALCGDIKLWVASCENGIMPDLENAVFQRKKDKMKSFAKEIREYFK